MKSFRFAILVAFAAFAAAPRLSAVSFLLLPTSNITGDAGTTVGWGIDIMSPDYDLFINSVSLLNFSPYPFGLSADDGTTTPVFTDYLSTYFFNNYPFFVNAAHPFHQEFQEGIPGDTGTGVGEFHIRSDAAPSAFENGDLYIVYDLFDSGGNQVDADGNPSGADLTIDLPVRISVTPATITPPGVPATPEPSTAAVVAIALAGIGWKYRRRRRLLTRAAPLRAVAVKERSPRGSIDGDLDGVRALPVDGEGEVYDARAV